MSSEQYQRTVNILDKEIAALEKKKAVADKKSVDEQKKATNITISKNASASMKKSKMKLIDKVFETMYLLFRSTNGKQK